MNRFNQILHNQIFLENYNIIEKYELNREFCKHDLTHLLDVARIMYIMSFEQNLKINKEIIYSTALLHDIGRALEYTKNIDHNIGAKEIALSILEDCKFEQSEIDEIIYAIISHNSEDNNRLNQLLRVADKLSRNCFACKKYDECKWEENRKNKGVEV